MGDGYEAFVEVLPDFSKLQSRADTQLGTILGKAGTSSGRIASNNIGASMVGGIERFGAPIAAAVASLGIGRLVGEAIGNGIRYSLDSIDLASDLNEAFNANNVTFGVDIANQLKELGSTAPQRLALTRNAFAGITTQFSAFAKTVRGNDVVGFLDELTTRGSDFASVYNLEVSDALQLFQSGLAGETEPLRKYGLDLSAAAVNAYAYANGIGTVDEELTEAEKVQARYGLLLASTSAVQGDATNTAGELAGQQRRLKVGFEEAQTQLGQYLLPGFLTLVTMANQQVIPAIGGIIDKVGPILGQALTDAGPQFDTLLDKVTPLVEKFVAGAAEDGIPAFIDAMNDAVDAAPDWIDAFEQTDAKVKDLDASYRNTSSSVADFFLPARQAFQDFLTAQNEAMAEDVANRVAVTAGFANAIEMNSELLKTRWKSSLDGLRKMTADFSLQSEGYRLAQGFADGITSGTELSTLAAERMALKARDKVRNTMQIQSPSKVMRELGGYVAEGMALGISDGTPAVESAVQSMISIPSLSGSLNISASALAGAGSSQPIIADGIGLIGWMRTTAEGAARLEFATQATEAYQDSMAGGLA